MKECGCKGHHFCSLCMNGRILGEADTAKKSTRQFVYCALCEGKAFRAGLDHQSHGDEHLVEFEDFVAIDGVLICDNVIDLKLENQLVSRMDQDEWNPSQTGRRKQDFGPKVNFKKRRWKLGDFTGLPALPMLILERLIEGHPVVGPKLSDFRVIEVCNLEYTPERGSYITAHFDDFHFWGRRIVTLNLVSATKLVLTQERSNESSQKAGQTNDRKPPDKSKSRDRMPAIEIVLNLARRSLLVLSGEARYEWKHEIRPEHIEQRRLAVTYRELSEQFQPGNRLFDDQISRLLELATNRV